MVLSLPFLSNVFLKEVIQHVHFIAKTAIQWIRWVLQDTAAFSKHELKWSSCKDHWYGHPETISPLAGCVSKLKVPKVIDLRWQTSGNSGAIRHLLPPFCRKFKSHQLQVKQSNSQLLPVQQASSAMQNSLPTNTAEKIQVFQCYS